MGLSATCSPTVRRTPGSRSAAARKAGGGTARAAPRRPVPRRSAGGRSPPPAPRPRPHGSAPSVPGSPVKIAATAPPGSPPAQTASTRRTVPNSRCPASGRSAVVAAARPVSGAQAGRAGVGRLRARGRLRPPTPTGRRRPPPAARRTPSRRAPGTVQPARRRRRPDPAHGHAARSGGRARLGRGPPAGSRTSPARSGFFSAPQIGCTEIASNSAVSRRDRPRLGPPGRTGSRPRAGVPSRQRIRFAGSVAIRAGGPAALPWRSTRRTLAPGSIAARNLRPYGLVSSDIGKCPTLTRTSWRLRQPAPGRRRGRTLQRPPPLGGSCCRAPCPSYRHAGFRKITAACLSPMGAVRLCGRHDRSGIGGRRHRAPGMRDPARRAVADRRPAGAARHGRPAVRRPLILRRAGADRLPPRRVRPRRFEALPATVAEAGKLIPARGPILPAGRRRVAGRVPAIQLLRRAMRGAAPAGPIRRARLARYPGSRRGSRDPALYRRPGAGAIAPPGPGKVKAHDLFTRIRASGLDMTRGGLGAALLPRAGWAPYCRTKTGRPRRDARAHQREGRRSFHIPPHVVGMAGAEHRHRHTPGCGPRPGHG